MRGKENCEVRRRVKRGSYFHVLSAKKIASSQNGYETIPNSAGRNRKQCCECEDTPYLHCDINQNSSSMATPVWILVLQHNVIQSLQFSTV